MRARAKRHAYDLVLKEFKNSGLNKAEVARRLGKGNPEISRMLGGPANWTIRTVADLLFAISGAAPTFGANHPLEKAPRNFTAWDQFSGSPTQTKLLKRTRTKTVGAETAYSQ